MRCRLLSIIFILSLFSSLASAQLQVFTDRTEWETAIGGSTIFVEDFNSSPLVEFDDGQTLTTPLLSVMRESSPNGSGALAILAGSEFGNLDGTNFLGGRSGEAPHERVVIQMPSVFAFGADFFSPFSGDGIALEINGELLLLDFITGVSEQGFIGVISDVSFQQVNIVGNPEEESFQELWAADNFSYAAIPEPSSAAVLLLGFAWAVQRRRYE